MYRKQDIDAAFETLKSLDQEVKTANLGLKESIEAFEKASKTFQKIEEEYFAKPLKVVKVQLDSSGQATETPFAPMDKI